MPTHINGRPVKTGSWTPDEDELLAEWQAKLGNRSVKQHLFTASRRHWTAESKQTALLSPVNVVNRQTCAFSKQTTG
jgi:hypothetical protein